MGVGVYQAKTHLPQLLERVRNGEHFTITKHGVPVAMLTPLEPVVKRDVLAVIDELKLFGKGQTTGGTTLKKMIEEGRR